MDSFLGVITSPRRIGSKDDWQSVAAFNQFSTAVDSDGYLYGWGQISGSMGSFGHEEDFFNLVDFPSPTKVSNIYRQHYDRGFAKVFNHRNSLGPGLALGKDNTLFSFGSNAQGMSGTNYIDANVENCLPSYGLPCIKMNSPVRPVESYKNFVSACCLPSDVVVAVSADGQLYAWGYHLQLDPESKIPPHGNSGSLPSLDIISPMRVGYHSGWTEVSCGDGFVILLNNQGMMYAARFLQDMPNYIAQPQSADPALSSQTTYNNIGATLYRIGSKSDWTSFSCGSAHVLAIDSLGRLYAWGRNGAGQLGDGTYLERNAPTRIGSESDWVTTAAGDACSFAINSKGHLYAWGKNYAQQGQNEINNLLGTGSTEKRLDSPTRVGTSSGWSSVSVGGLSTIGSFVLATRDN